MVVVGTSIPIDFPVEPYDCQVAYMEKVVEALSNGGNALLESPTGTGKTLCLLCASLAWQKRNVVTTQVPSDGKKTKTTARFRTIIYASRTHTQLSQVVSELKCTAYKNIKMTVLGSRDQLCIHPQLKKLKGASLNHACSRKSSSRSCSYKTNLDKYERGENGVPLVLDIEEMIRYGKDDSVCPYFGARKAADNAQLVLLPYNYLLDSSIRKSLPVSWAESIVIFDEAHNLEKSASDAASLTMKSSQIGTCIEELKTVLTILRKDGTTATSTAAPENSASQSTSSSASSSKGLGDVEGKIRTPSLHVAMQLLKALFELERRIDSIPLSMNSQLGYTPCNTLPGSWLMDTLEASGFLFADVHRNVQELDFCSGYLMEQMSSVMGSGGEAAASKEPIIAILSKLLNRVFKGKTKDECRAISADYKIFISEEEKKVYGSSLASSYNKPSISKGWVLNYWSFCPGIALVELKSMGVRSVILTSGTLAPLGAFKMDMKLPFATALENPHVIRDSQIWVSTVATGATGEGLNSTYAKRELNSYKDDLGTSILRICTTMSGQGSDGVSGGPSLSGGILVFFVSYDVMEGMLARWKQTKLYDALERMGGSIIVEPKGVGLGHNASSKSQTTAQKKPKQQDMFSIVSKSTSTDQGNPEAAEENEVNSIISLFNSKISSNGRCILMAVYQGKISEGMDFKDNLGRVVIATGIPYAPYKNPWVALKKQYLDEICKPHPSAQQSIKSNSSSVVKAASIKQQISVPFSLEGGGPPLKYVPLTTQPSFLKASTSMSSGNRSTTVSSDRLDGNAWYSQTALRAVNQALGRIIRHKKDWGAIFLLDDRFYTGTRESSQLCSWVRPKLKKYKDFKASLQSFREFFTAAMNDPALQIADPQVHVSASRSRVEPLLDEDGQDEQALYSVDVVSSNVAAGDAYIPPELLLSQDPSREQGRARPPPPPAAMCVNVLVDKKAPLDISLLLADHNSSSKTKTTFENDVVAAKRSRTDVPESKVPVKSVNKSATFGLSSSSKFGLVGSGKASSGSVGLSQESLVPKRQIISIAEMTKGLSASKRPHSTGGLGLCLPTAPPKPTALAPSPIDIVLDQLVGYLSEDKLHGLKTIIEPLKRNDFITKSSEVVGMVDQVMNIVSSLKSSEFITQLMGHLSRAIPIKYVGIFESATRRRCGLMANLSHSSQSVPSVGVGKTIVKEGSSGANEGTKGNGLSLPSQPFPIVKKMEKVSTVVSGGMKQKSISAPTNTANVPNSQPAVSVFNNLELSKDGSKSVKNPSNLLCSVCKEVANAPCVNRTCGHICCNVCWFQWLRAHATCPVCRKPATKTTVGKVNVVKKA